MPNEDFENIDRPYDTYLKRSTGETVDNNGSLETQPVKSDGAMSDVWIKNFIRSENWQPKKVGFYINGQTGYAEFSNVFVSGDIQAMTGTIGGFTITATSLSVTSGGNTVTISSGANAFIAGPTGDPSAIITQAGAATFVGITTLNIKSYTDFETSGRFGQTSGGTGGATFGTSGLDITTGATATSFETVTWFLSQNMYAGSPVFTTVFEMVSAAGSNGSAFFGLGTPTNAGNGHTFSVAHIGFKIDADGVATRLYATQSDGTELASSQLTTIAAGDVVDLIFKVNGSTSVDYYWRKNVGTLSAKTTLTGNVPTGANNKCQFSIDNISVANTFRLLLVSASLER